MVVSTVVQYTTVTSAHITQRILNKGPVSTRSQQPNASNDEYLAWIKNIIFVRQSYQLKQLIYKSRSINI